MRFIDLFAGLGGFHVALRSLGHQCVFASEIDEGLRHLYARNFGLAPAGDICRVQTEEIEKHEVLCAGFPCQPFSKAGEQRGLSCPRDGRLFYEVLRVIDAHEPPYLILENVPNLLRHAHGATWAEMKRQLESRGYEVDAHPLSPHQFGIPQIRERVFVVGSRTGLGSFAWPLKNGARAPSVVDVLDTEPTDAQRLTPKVASCLEAWQGFLDMFPESVPLPSFPIWSMEFGADYPYEDATPHALGFRELRQYRGAHGVPLGELSDEEIADHLPSYARTPQERFPKWKVDFITQNRRFYALHKAKIDAWVPRIRLFPPSLQKFEWNCQGEERVIWRYVIQFRASGVRVKRPTTAPSLVAMTSTQVPIIGWERRYMTPRECARLQSLGDLDLPEGRTKAYQALGNAVNADVAARVARMLLP